MARQDLRVIARTALVERLAATPGRRVVTIIAPAGYGKSTLVEAWGAASHVRLAVCPLASIHDSPATFGLHLVETLAPHLPDVEDMHAEASEPDPDWPRVLLPRLVHALRGAHLALVFDDVQELRNPKVVDLLSTLVAVLPRHVTLGMVGRSLPDLSLSKTALEGRLVEISAAHLELTLAELSALRRFGVDEQTLVQIFNSTGGWPAGVRIALLRHEATRELGPDGSSSSSRVGDSQAAPWVLGDYLEEEVLSALSPQRLEFLHDLALLTPVEADLLAAARSADDTVGQIRQIRTDPIPMVTTRHTPSGDLVVMHPLLAKHLKDPARRLTPAGRSLLLRAAAYHISKKDLDRAFEMVRRIGDQDVLAEFVYTKSVLVILTGRTNMVRRWLSFFTESDLRRHPSLALTWVSILGTEGDNEAAEPWLEAYGRWVNGPEALRMDESPFKLDEFFNEMLASGVISTPIATAAATDTIWHALGATVAGHKLAMAGVWREAEAMLLGAISQQPDLGLNDVWRLSLLAYISEQVGRPDRADEHTDKCAAVLDKWGLHNHVNTYCAAVGLAATSLRRGDRENAHAHIRAGMLKIPQTTGRPEAKMTAYLGLARVAFDLEARTLGHTCVQEARALAPAVGELPVLIAQLEELERQHPNSVQHPPGEQSEHGLSSAELRVLQFLSSFYPVPRIAQELVLSPSTVRTHIRSIYRKLGVHERVDAVSAARQRGLIN